MPAAVQILQVVPTSDGTGSTPVTSVGMVRNDAYFLDRIAEEWAKDRGLPSGMSYRLNRLPPGYGGFERTRDNTKHIDRYLYGHPRGVFRSLRELYPHFKHLQEHQSTHGCQCKLCAGAAKRTSDVGSTSSGSIAGKLQSPNIPPVPRVKAAPKRSLLYHSPEPVAQVKHKQVDELGTPDIYRTLLDKLKAEGTLDERIIDSMSPDWRAGHSLLMSLLDEWQSLPGFVPRGGELVLFSRSLAPNESLGWDCTAQSLCRISRGEWLDCPVWEVGVVTQMPINPIDRNDLSQTSEANRSSITYSGFRIEPLAHPNSDDKALTRQHKYVLPHAIRPLAFWRQCLGNMDIQHWHPTIRHALTVTRSFCIMGKYQFKGTWPEATIFARGVYLGSELILVGDAVRLLPRVGLHADHAITDMMVITSIRLRFVNLEEANDDDYDDERPYTTCLHIAGRVFTLDPARSFDSTGRWPVRPAAEPFFPAGMQGYGQWYHLLDPSNPQARLEVPYTRIMGRCPECAALKAWFSTPNDMPPRTGSLRAGHSPQPSGGGTIGDLSQGLAGLREAQSYSLEHDSRIDKGAGKSWFWADSRIEQLDLHEVNGRFVGAKDPSRTKKKMHTLRQALKLLDGKKGSVEEYMAERKRLKAAQEQSDGINPALSAWGLVAGSAPDHSADSSTSSSEQDRDAVGDAMDVDEDIEAIKDVEDTSRASQVQSQAAAVPEVVSILDDDSDEMYD